MKEFNPFLFLVIPGMTSGISRYYPLLSLRGQTFGGLANFWGLWGSAWGGRWHCRKKLMVDSNSPTPIYYIGWLLGAQTIMKKFGDWPILGALGPVWGGMGRYRKKSMADSDSPTPIYYIGWLLGAPDNHEKIWWLTNFSGIHKAVLAF